MRTTNLLKIHQALMTIFLTAIITLFPYSFAKSIQKIPESFTKGTWILMPSTKAEIDYCKGQTTFDYDAMRVFSFNLKTNSFEIGGYEDVTKVKILSFSEITPVSIKGKAEYTNEYYENVDVTTKNFDFTIKNNRLYSNSEFSAEYDPRARKYGIYHCIKPTK